MLRDGRPQVLRDLLTRHDEKRRPPGWENGALGSAIIGKPTMRFALCRRAGLVCEIEQLLGLAFQFEPHILMLLVARDAGDALNKIENR